MDARENEKKNCSSQMDALHILLFFNKLREFYKAIVNSLGSPNFYQRMKKERNHTKYSETPLYARQHRDDTANEEIKYSRREEIISLLTSGLFESDAHEQSPLLRNPARARDSLSRLFVYSRTLSLIKSFISLQTLLYTHLEKDPLNELHDDDDDWLPFFYQLYIHGAVSS